MEQEAESCRGDEIILWLCLARSCSLPLPLSLGLGPFEPEALKLRHRVVHVRTMVRLLELVSLPRPRQAGPSARAGRVGGGGSMTRRRVADRGPRSA